MTIQSARLIGMLVVISAVCSLGVSGCARQAPPPAMPPAALQALERARSLELYALDPTRHGEKPEGTAFHDWHIIGSSLMQDAATIGRLVNALADGVAAHEHAAAACFDPRHGIRVIDSGRQHDFVICFECFFVHWFIDDARQVGFPVAKAPQQTFDDVLNQAGIMRDH